MSDDIYQKGDPCGPYRIDGFLDAGGFAEVYAATNLLTGRRAALKVLQADRGKIEEVLRRFKHEIQLLAALQHVNVVGFYEAGLDGGRIWAAMELLDGRTLRAHLHERGALEVEEALGFLYEVACGVAAAQEIGVVHRDIKPENVFLTAPGVAKVLDFGIAKFEGWGFQSTGRGGRQVLGTPSYMSPEQIEGVMPTFASDVYQAGLCAYEMLSGKHPWSYGNGELPTQTQICDLQVNAAPRRFKGLRDDVWTLIEKALRKRPEDRWADMNKLAAATWDVLETIRIERSSPEQPEDRRNPSAADGSSLGPLARRAFLPAHTPANETPPPVPSKKVELRLVKNEVKKEGRTASLKTAQIDGATQKRGPVIHTTVPLDRKLGVPEPTAQQWIGASPPQERTTAPMPAPGTAGRDHSPAWVRQARSPATEGSEFLDYIVPRGTPWHAPPSSTTPTLVSMKVPARAVGKEGEEEGEALREAPTWLVVMMLMCAVTSVTLSGYYLLRGGGEGREPAAAATAAEAPTVMPTATVTPAPANSAAAASATAAAVTPAKAPHVAPQTPRIPTPKPTPSAAPASTASTNGTQRAPHRLIDVEN